LGKCAQELRHAHRGFTAFNCRRMGSFFNFGEVVGGLENVG